MWLAASVGTFTLLLSLSLTYLVRTQATRLGFVAAPRQDRWHQQPTALMGGIAIYAAFLAGYFLVFPPSPKMGAILIAGTLLFATGIADDLLQFKPYIKLVMQLVAAAITVYAGLRLQLTDSELLNDFITIFWLVGLTNAVNLLDNMDGLAGGISFIACVFLAITFLLNDQTYEAMLGVLLAGAVLGFLFFNFNPASIFMGDCGSMFLGYTLGGIALLSNYGFTRNLASVFLTPVLILMIPIFDTCLVTITRKGSGRPVSQGGRDHTSHRLVALGMSERRAVLVLYLLAAASGALALLVRGMRLEVTVLVVSGFALTIILLGLYLGKVRVYEDGLKHGNELVNVLKNFAYKRRVFEILLDFSLIVLAYFGAYLLRFENELPAEQWAIFIRTLPLIIAIQLLLFLAGGIYRGLWRYVGIDDFLAIARTVGLGVAASALVVFLAYRFQGPSRVVFMIDALLLVVFVAASRLSFRLFAAMLVGHRVAQPNARPVLIYGAGDGGDFLIRELINHPELHYRPIAFIDDDERKAGKLIRGYRIFSSSALPELVEEHGVNDVLISSVKVPESKLDFLRGLGLAPKRLRIQLE
jgi:UDP-GlcNAc:undecaprenyl-phosphate/decaprenyl-phosphate GlcNAc-1-phosphate transferase